LAHTQDDREASEALVKTFAEKLKTAAAEKKELKEELAALENTVCELEDRLDEALDDADTNDDDGDFVERLSSEEARAGRRCVRLPLLIPATRAHDQASRQASYTEPDPRLSSPVQSLRYHVVHHKVFFFSSAHGDHIFTLRPHFLS
jgi:uncharacterized protein YceH (UPF0502 family)